MVFVLSLCKHIKRRLVCLMRRVCSASPSSFVAWALAEKRKFYWTFLALVGLCRASITEATWARRSRSAIVCNRKNSSAPRQSYCRGFSMPVKQSLRAKFFDNLRKRWDFSGAFFCCFRPYQSYLRTSVGERIVANEEWHDGSS